MPPKLKASQPNPKPDYDPAHLYCAAGLASEVIGGTYRRCLPFDRSGQSPLNMGQCLTIYLLNTGTNHSSYTIEKALNIHRSVLLRAITKVEDYRSDVPAVDNHIQACELYIQQYFGVHV
jgi:hypothetical protein